MKQWWTVLPETAAQRTQDEPWSLTHGFFIQMGGFLLCERGVATQILDYPRFKHLLKKKAVDVPLLSKDDIQDHSKGDAISKGFVVLQTTWFVVQCTARVTRGLPLCELEVVTLGFAVLNAIIYGVWWNKPQGVSTCAYVPLKDATAMSNTIHDLIDIVQQNAPQRTLTSSPTEATTNPNCEASETKWLAFTKQDLLELLDSLLHQKLARTPPVIQLPKNTRGWLGRQIYKDYHRFPLTATVLLIPYRCMQFILRPIAKMAESDTVLAGTFRVPTFYAYSGSDPDPWSGPQSIPHSAQSANGWTMGRFFGLLRPTATPSAFLKNFPFIEQLLEFARILPEVVEQTNAQAASAVQSQAYLASCAIGTVFGAVHLLAWSSTSATAVERDLWRVSAIIITVVPAVVVVGWRVFRFLGILRKQEIIASRYPGVIKFIKFVQVGVPALLGVPFYVLARCTLLILALISLRNLPPRVHADVSWPSFIPHF